MARRKGNKRNKIVMIVLLLLLLLVGWRVWHWSANRMTDDSQSQSPRNTASSSYAAPQSGAASQGQPVPISRVPLPNVSFDMPPMRPPPQPAPIDAAPPVARVEPSPAATPGVKTPPRPATAKPKRPPAPAASQRIARAPTRPVEQPSAAPVFGMPGSPIDGYAIIRNKFHDTANNRYLVSCTTDGSNLIYIYEVDADIFEEAQSGLMYNPSKVSRWRFVSSR